MELRTGSVSFPSLQGGGPRTATQAVIFPRQVIRATAGLTGYATEFTPFDDHHLGNLTVKVDATINANVVLVTGTYGLEDWSGNWDDNYDGTIEFVVVAELEAPGGPPPRADLSIIGIEFNQATQSFRDGQFLDAPHVQPDNSIRLIARKQTGVRVYVDYDSGAGLPPIASLSGELRVTTSIGSTTLNLSPVATIKPRRDAQIDRRVANHTLNFVIPEAWSQGELSLTCHVFDAATPADKSPAFNQTIRFADVAPLRVFGVGVHYTGEGLDLAAPTQAQVVGTLLFVQKTYPVGEIFLAGYSAINFSVNMVANISDGCGNGFNSLLDRLRDMRGSSNDVYCAVLPGGIDSGSVGGCGGGGVAAVFVGGGTAAAQEIGHAFGRQHAPCDDSTRCDKPANTDSNYPKYDSFPSDSIGEVGYDPATNSVFDPASFFDFMGYSGPVWVSPYTYTGLMGAFPSTTGVSGSAQMMLRAAFDNAGGGGAVQGGGGEWRRKETDTLFLGLSIDRDRTVERRPSFHYQALYTFPRGTSTSYTVELHDEAGKVLGCETLHEDCYHCDGDCWPKTFRDPIPFAANAAKLVVWEGKDKLYEEEIPKPPRVQVKCDYSEKDKAVDVRWSATDPEGRGDLWYLVQWKDRDGTWRGVAPRTRETFMKIPAAALGWYAPTIRVLATSGIATGSDECRLDVEFGPTPPPQIVVVDPPISAEPGASLSPTIEVAVLESSGRTVPDAEIIWYDERGAELARGRSFDLRQLPEGEHVLRATAVGHGVGQPEKRLLVQLGPAGRPLRVEELLIGPDPARDQHTHQGPAGSPKHPAQRTPNNHGRGGTHSHADHE